MSRDLIAIFTKAAATRYEKEIAKGTIQRSDLVPELTTNIPSGPFGAAQRKMTRDQLAAYEPPTPGIKFTPEKATRLRALQHKNDLAHVNEVAPGFTGKIKPVPGMYAATAFGSVHAPEGSGQFVRTMNQSPLRATAATFTSQPEALFVPPKPSIDPHLTHAVGQHEIGEAASLRRAAEEHALNRRAVIQGGSDEMTAMAHPLSVPVRPFASHLGTEPILRENISVSKAPAEAVQEMAKLRQMHPDDALVQKMIRNAGGTPNAPLPLGGRAERALARMYDRLPVTALDRGVRSTWLNRTMNGDVLRPVHLPRGGTLSNVVDNIKRTFGGADPFAKGPEAIREGAREIIKGIGHGVKYLR